MNKSIAKIILFLLLITIVWMIGGFVAWCPTWFIDTGVGRVIAIILFLIILIGTIKED